MSGSMKLLLIAGARPNFMKIAPVIRAIDGFNDHASDTRMRIDYRLIHTGQHYDSKMSSVFFKELGIPAPDLNLEVGSGSHAIQTASVMTKFEPVCVEEKPDWVIVVGDVNSTMACTLVAAKLGTAIAHLEAGLRSFDRTMPEEINRLVTDALSDLLLTPSEDANDNLRKEGIPEDKVRLVGNIMIDALVENLPRARESRVLAEQEVEPGHFAYVTLHRPANVDDPDTLGAIVHELRRLSEDLPVVFPMHPRTRKMLSHHGLSLNGCSGMHIIEPVGYHDSLCLTENARLVVTDSGGLQEESTYFQTPCLTVRPNTERPVTVTAGSNKLTCAAQLEADIASVLNKPSRLGQVPPLWDGRTGARVIDCLVELAAAS